MGRIESLNTTESFCFDLPKEYIAQYPAKNRDASRLLVLKHSNSGIEHRSFNDIADYLSAGDCLVINKTKVFPARLDCKKTTGGQVDVLLLEKLSKTTWKVLLRDKVLNKKLVLPDGTTTALITSKTSDGEYIIEVSGNGTDVSDIINKYGRVPLPPYIKRTNVEEVDRTRYQTVYAKVEGSVAAPTAGLHFTRGIMEKLKNKGIIFAEIILHIGWGTFKPITVKTVSEHRMLPEYFEVEKSEAEKVNLAKRNGKRLVAVGTSSVRTLETLSDNEGFLKPGKGSTDLFISPGYKFKCVDAMVTNFHLSKSTPLMLVCALAGKENIFSAYRAAMENGYRFYSYGDAMLIL